MRVESTQAEEDLCNLRFLYRPGDTPESLLVVLVHGRAGNREVMWLFERCIPTGAAVVAFEGYLPDSGMSRSGDVDSDTSSSKGRAAGFSWWDMNGGPPSIDTLGVVAERLEGAIASFITLKHIAPNKIVAIGFSQGAALLSVLLQRRQFRIDGVAILAGFVIPCENVVVKNGKTPSVFVAHGDQDPIIEIDRASDSVNFLRNQGYHVTFFRDPVAHKIGIQGTKGLKIWLESFG